jgi:hypothetical protein
MHTRTTSVRITREDYRRLERLARRENRSRVKQISQLLDEAFERRGLGQRSRAATTEA